LPELRRPSSHLPPPAYIPPSGVPSGHIPPSGNSSRRASSTRPAGVRPFAWPEIDSDDEEEQMFAEMFEEEMAAATQDEEHMLTLACLSGLYAEAAIGRRGGSAPGRKKFRGFEATPTSFHLICLKTCQFICLFC
jgi:hypothetical protein